MPLPRLRRLVVAYPVRFAVLLAVGLGLPSLRSGLMLDDHAHLAALRGEWPLAWWDLFRFLPGNPEQTRAWTTDGPLPWWTDPDVKIAFFRPLSAALVRLDVAAFGERYELFHAHSLVWTALWVASAALVLRSVLPRATSTVALFLFAAAPLHWAPVYWLASRNAIVASSFVGVALWAHVRARQGLLRHGALLAAALFALALLAGEAALGGLGYFIAYEALRAPRQGRWKSLSALTGVTIAWLVAYRTMGYGTRATGFYADPINEPLALLRSLPRHALTQFGTIVLLVPSHIGVFDPRAVAPQIVVGLLAIAVAVAMTRVAWRETDADERRDVVWLAIGALLSIVPGLAGSPGPRALAIGSLGFAAVIAFWILGVRRRVLRGGRGTAWPRVGFISFVALHGVVPIAYWPAFAFFSQRALGAGSAAAIALPMNAEAESSLVLLTVSDPPTGLYLPFIRRESGLPLIAHYTLLSVVPVAHRVKRLDARTFELAPVGRRFGDTPFERIVRRRAGPPLGATTTAGRTEVTVVAEDDGSPTRIRVRLPAALEESNVFAWSHGRYERIDALAIGDERILER